MSGEGWAAHLSKAQANAAGLPTLDGAGALDLLREHGFVVVLGTFDGDGVKAGLVDVRSATYVATPAMLTEAVGPAGALGDVALALLATEPRTRGTRPTLVAPPPLNESSDPRTIPEEDWRPHTDVVAAEGACA